MPKQTIRDDLAQAAYLAVFVAGLCAAGYLIQRPDPAMTDCLYQAPQAVCEKLLSSLSH